MTAHNVMDKVYFGKHRDSWSGLSFSGRGLSHSEIANDLDITEVRIHDCIEWMQHFLHCKDPNELAQGLHARLNIGQ